MNQLLVVETERLFIRPYKSQDLEESFRLMQDKELFRYLHFDVMTYEEYQGLFNWLIESYEANGSDFKYSFAIFLKKTGQIIGWVGVGNLDFIDKEKEIYYLIGREHWGNGYAFEAARKIVDYCFNSLRLERLVAKVDPKNLASKRVIEKLGFRFEYILSNLPEEHSECNGELLYSLSNRVI